MTPITDKIKQLPDGYRLFLSNTNGAFTRDSEIDTDDLKSLVADLEAKTRALEQIRDWTGNDHVMRQIAADVLSDEESWI